MSQVFRTQRTIKFRDADPAQIMYFGNLVSFAHDAFEDFIVAAGYRWNEWFRLGDLLIPIRHAEADFLAPFIPGRTYDIEVSVSLLKETSFQMKYVFSENGKTHGVVKMVHSVIEKATMQKKALPTEMRERLAKFQEVTP